MAEYRSTLDGDERLDAWLARHLSLSPVEVYIQSGYVDPKGLEMVLPPRLNLTQTRVKLMLGSGKGQLSPSVLYKALPIAASGGRIIVIHYSDALFHPKTYLVTSQDGAKAASVGSPNLTNNGLRVHDEAYVSLDSGTAGDESAINSIEAKSQSCGADGSSRFAVDNEQSIKDLITAKIIGQRTVNSVSLPSPAGKPKVALVVAPPPIAANLPPIVATWSKTLQSSDAQWTKPGTNPTGKLRLTKGAETQTYFRFEFFAACEWRSEIRDGNVYEVAWIRARCFFAGIDLGDLTFQLDHASHREAGQDNVTTVLSWGLELGARLRATSMVGGMVRIDALADGTFVLAVSGP